jgi:hypothetical protein
MPKLHPLLVVIAVLLCRSMPATAQTTAAPGAPPDSRNAICSMIESAARANSLPVAFFARLIWVESRFRPDEIGPSTRTGEHALGIAQFMPGTAVEHGLFEPFDPDQALTKSGEFLADLRNEFGNLGLAAAAYNAGPQRVHDFIAGLRDLPAETRNYVLSITGRPIENWVRAVDDPPELKSEQGADATMNCWALAASLERVRTSFAKVPSWCRYLHQPDKNICGPVHEDGAAIRLSSLGTSNSRLHLLTGREPNSIRSSTR